MENKISGISKAILVLSALLLATNIFLPIWSIQLWAPQYPEGLVLLIYADKLGGNVDIINGLNHYIGMQTLHAENFIEFSILRYIIGFFVLFILITAFIGRKKAVNILFIAFVLQLPIARQSGDISRRNKCALATAAMLDMHTRCNKA